MAYEDTEDFKNLKKAQAREDADANDPGTESTAAFMKRTGTKANAPKATFGGSRVVSKKELEASGLSLRDFLNKERGLTPRKDSAKADTSRANEIPPGPKQKIEDDTKPAKTEEEKKFGVFGAKGRNPSPANPSKYKKGGKVESKLMGKEGRGMAKATMQKVASKAVKGHEGRMHKMKSGGTVSSASKRADGIAMKGKTRGRMM